MRRHLLLLALVALTSTPVLAEPAAPQFQHKPITDRDLTDDQARAVAYSERVGHKIFAHDQAAWGATDFVRAKGIKPEGLVGWITEDAGESIRVLWIAQNGDQLTLRYETRNQGQAVVDGSFQSFDGGKPLEPRQVAAFKARQNAASSGFERCPGTYNSVVLPSEPGEPDGYNVFLLVALPDWSKVMVGGNVLIRMDGTGMKVLETKSYTKSCLVLGGDEAPAGAKPVALYMSDVMSQTPTPIHVFLNLQHNETFFVLTTANGIVWEVKNGEIRPVERLERPQ